jgi:hypothetical protein
MTFQHHVPYVIAMSIEYDHDGALEKRGAFDLVHSDLRTRLFDGMLFGGAVGLDLPIGTCRKEPESRIAREDSWRRLLAWPLSHPSSLIPAVTRNLAAHSRTIPALSIRLTNSTIHRSLFDPVTSNREQDQA